MDGVKNLGKGDSISEHLNGLVFALDHLVNPSEEFVSSQIHFQIITF